MEDSVPENECKPGRLGRHQPFAESEVFAELDALGLLDQQRIRSGVDDEPVDLFAEDHAARTGGALEQDERQTSAMELVTGCQPRNAAANDDYGIHTQTRDSRLPDSGSYEVGEHGNEGRRRIQRCGAAERDAALVGGRPGLHVDVEQDLGVIADKADGHDEE